ncbi:MAG: replication-associated recombination protein A [Candidatus Hydrogenedentota bacterium]|nr:MAG: replication-associated recombination protein A [Candidatus Hydrogenedentota bacterium]
MEPDLFEGRLGEFEPLARRMRPRDLSEFVGQEKILERGALLERILDRGILSSLVLFGPPGTGKTAMAHLIAQRLNAEFVPINAVTSGVADLRRESEAARRRLKHHSRRTVLFIDEIHRFNKAQQDALLPDLENGILVLVGATTHNPAFVLNDALASRTHFVEFEALSDEAIRRLVKRALEDEERGLGGRAPLLTETALDTLVRLACGDARRALNLLELCATGNAGKTVEDTDVERLAGRRIVRYDRDEDSHYDHASAFIKSMRGSDPDAAVYYMARMLEGGEDPRFIARRMMILASEDVGNADAKALILAAAAAEAVERVGMPEARIILAQCATYLACAPKSNAAYLAVDEALSDIRAGRECPVPQFLKDASYADAKCRGHGKGYLYPHDHGGFVKRPYLSNPRTYYRPTEHGEEKRLRERLIRLWGEWPRRGKESPKEKKR